MSKHRRIAVMCILPLLLVALLSIAFDGTQTAAALTAVRGSTELTAAGNLPAPGAITRSNPYERALWEYDQRTYPLGYIPGGAYQRALNQIAQSRAARPQTPAAASWVNIGPGPETGGQIGQSLGGPNMSGRVNSIAVDPSNASHWLIAASTGGIWETSDGGTTWAPRTDNQPTLAMGAVAFAPGSPNIVYAGMGDPMPMGQGYAGGGLLQSADGGTNWTLAATTPFSNTNFKRIAVNPADANTLLAATVPGTWGRAFPYAPPFQSPSGVYKSTNGGMNWTLNLTGTATGLVATADNFNFQYAALGAIAGAIDNGVYRSIDGGDSWQSITGTWNASLAGRIELALSPSATGTLYVSIQNDTNNRLLGLFRTDNAWDATPSWTQVPVTGTDDGSGQYGYCAWDAAFGTPSDQCWYDHVLSVDPTNPNTLYAGGVPLWKCTNCSTTPTWTEVSQTSDVNKGIHVDQHSMAWAGTTRLIVGNDGGLFSTNDGGATWTSHNTNLATLLFYDGSIHPTNPNVAIGGAQDNGSSSRTGGTSSWRMIGSGDGSDNAISLSSPDTNWAISSQSLGIQRTTDGGTTLSDADTGIDKTGVPFIARFEMCPQNDDVFIAGTNKVWRANNFFSSAPLTPTWSANSPIEGSVSAMAFAPSDGTCNTYAIGTRTGGISLTVDGGVTWTGINNGTPGRYVTYLAFDPANADVLYATFSGFDEYTPLTPGHVFKTSNARDATPAWVNISTPVNLPHNSIAVDRQMTGTLYVATDLGVWVSIDSGATWTHEGPEVGMPNVPVYELKVSPAERVYAFTHGRSAFMRSPTSTLQIYLPLIQR